MKKTKQQTQTQNGLIALLVLIELRQLNRQLEAEQDKLLTK